MSIVKRIQTENRIKIIIFFWFVANRLIVSEAENHNFYYNIDYI